MLLHCHREAVFALAGILAFTDKVIAQETAGRIRRAIEMTQAAMIFEEEKRRAVEQAVEGERKKALESERRAVEAEKKKALDSQREIVLKMIESGYSTEEIVFLVSDYSKEEVEAMRKKQGNKSCEKPDKRSI